MSIRQPRCMVEPRSTGRVLGLLAMIMLPIFLLGLWLPAWIVLPLALLGGVTAVSHPVCFLTHYQHHRTHGRTR